MSWPLWRTMGPSPMAAASVAFGLDQAEDWGRSPAEAWTVIGEEGLTTGVLPLDVRVLNGVARVSEMLKAVGACTDTHIRCTGAAKPQTSETRPARLPTVGASVGTIVGRVVFGEVNTCHPATGHPPPACEQCGTGRMTG